MYKIAVMGDRDSILGFGALGLDVFPTENPTEARHTLHKLAREEYAIIYMTEQLASQLSQEIHRYHDSVTPAIILIPGREGSLGIGMNNIQQSIQRAVGADIL